MRTNKRVGAVVLKDGMILLIHRFRDGEEYWVLPGGGVEDGETLEVALRREVAEEIGLELLSFELIGQSEEGDHLQYFYKCEIPDGEMTIGGPEKERSSENNVYILEWVFLDKVGELQLYPGTVRQFLTS